MKSTLLYAKKNIIESQIAKYFSNISLEGYVLSNKSMYNSSYHFIPK